MTADADELAMLAAQVRSLVQRVAGVFGASTDLEPALDAASGDEPGAGPTAHHGWSYLVRVPVPADAVERLDGPVRTLLVGEGFEVVDRDSPSEVARQFRSPRVDLGVQLARSGRGDVVIGASATAD